MDTIELGLKRIDEHNTSAINKHKELLSKAITESASISNKCSKNLDNEFNKIFSELDKLNNIETNIFNPITVIEFRDNKAYQIIDTWDKDNGLLPERKVMGEYYVDIGIYINKPYCINSKQYIGSFNSMSRTFECGHGSSDNNDAVAKIHLLNYSNYNPDLIRNKDTIPFYSTTTYTFQVDNYLNLYHIESGLYLMFNKTSFPLIPFHFKTNNYNKVVVYDSKRLEQLINPKLFDKDYHSSIDNRSTFLNDINSIIPDDIITAYDFFNRFRKFKQFTFENTNIDLLIPTPDTTSSIIDPRDKLIESYKQRLETTTKRAENAEKIMQTMLEEYELQSIDIKAFNYKIRQLKTEILDNKLQYKTDLLENETKQILYYVNTIEDLKTSNFRLNQQLLEIETYKTKTDTMGQSIETLKQENATTLLTLEKQRAMNEKLMNTVKTQKTKNDSITQQNTEYKNNYMSLESNYISLKNDLLKLEETLKDKKLECHKMTETFKQLGNTSTDVLENALSEKIDTLTISNEKLKEEKNKLTIDFNKVSKQLEKLQSTLKNMLE
jgi:hypothetical protein